MINKFTVTLQEYKNKKVGIKSICKGRYKTSLRHNIN